MGWLEPTSRAHLSEAAWPDLPSGPYYFAWRLSGDRTVGPLQVFDNGRDTWLQFLPDQALPAVFGVRDGVAYLLPYQRRGPYVHVTGIWSRLVLRGGALTANADHLGNIPSPSSVESENGRATAPCLHCDATAPNQNP